MILKKLQPNASPCEIPLKMAEFWVKAHNLLVSFFTHKVTKVIGASLGEFINVDKKTFEGNWKSFLRVRVLLDITILLHRKMKMKRAGGDVFWINFKYEWLPNFCFLCGIIGHMKCFCHHLFEGVNDETKRQYGSWLRATGKWSSTSTGNPWLVSDIPSTRSAQWQKGQVAGTKVSKQKKVEQRGGQSESYHKHGWKRQNWNC